jgi:hypothetical protein
MRCFFTQNGRIRTVDLLSPTDDPSRIEEAHRLFETKGNEWGADGFEVWDGRRFLYRFPETAAKGQA